MSFTILKKERVVRFKKGWPSLMAKNQSNKHTGIRPYGNKFNLKILKRIQINNNNLYWQVKHIQRKQKNIKFTKKLCKGSKDKK